MATRKLKPAEVKALFDGVLAWLREPQGEKGWQALTTCKPTPAEAISMLAREGLTSKSRPGAGVVGGTDEHPAAIVATYPDGRRIVTRSDDGLFLVGADQGHALANMPLYLATFTRIAESAEPLATAAEIAGAADKRAAEESERKRASMVKGAEKALRDAWSIGDSAAIAGAEAYARAMGVDPANVDA